MMIDSQLKVLALGPPESFSAAEGNREISTQGCLCCLASEEGQTTGWSISCLRTVLLSRTVNDDGKALFSLQKVGAWGYQA